MSAYDECIDELDSELEDGTITQKEHREAMRDIHWEIEEEAQDAYNDVIDRHGW